jgi:ornithine cyclodeaminase/alanine dehydrogenase-like protein (mu-crystallin family)
MVLVLSNEDVARVLTMERCMAALEDGYREEAAGRAVNQLRYDTNMPLPERSERHPRYEFKTMVGIIPKLGVAALRMSSTLNHWPIRDGVERDERLYVAPIAGAPQGGTVGLIQLYSTETGEPLAFLPDGVLQGMRVGGTYGLAIKHLARKDATTLGLIGSGHQARYQVAAAQVARPLAQVKVYSPTREHREAFAAEIGDEYGLDVTAVDTPEEAVRDVDVLVAATNARARLVSAEMVRPGMHVQAVQNEISNEALAKADLIAAHSSRRYIIYRGGEGTGQYGRLDSNEGRIDHATLPLLDDIIAGKVPGRTRDDQITMFQSGSGMGLQFAAVGAAVLALAREHGLGHEIPTDWFTQTLHT